MSEWQWQNYISIVTRVLSGSCSKVDEGTIERIVKHTMRQHKDETTDKLLDLLLKVSETKQSYHLAKENEAFQMKVNELGQRLEALTKEKDSIPPPTEKEKQDSSIVAEFFQKLEVKLEALLKEKESVPSPTKQKEEDASIDANIQERILKLLQKMEDSATDINKGNEQQEHSSGASRKLKKQNKEVGGRKRSGDKSFREQKTSNQMPDEYNNLKENAPICQRPLNRKPSIVDNVDGRIPAQSMCNLNNDTGFCYHDNSPKFRPNIGRHSRIHDGFSNKAGTNIHHCLSNHHADYTRQDQPSSQRETEQVQCDYSSKFSSAIGFQKMKSEIFEPKQVNFHQRGQFHGVGRGMGRGALNRNPSNVDNVDCSLPTQNMNKLNNSTEFCYNDNSSKFKPNTGRHSRIHDGFSKRAGRNIHHYVSNCDADYTRQNQLLSQRETEQIQCDCNSNFSSAIGFQKMESEIFEPQQVNFQQLGQFHGVGRGMGRGRGRGRVHNKLTSCKEESIQQNKGKVQELKEDSEWDNFENNFKSKEEAKVYELFKIFQEHRREQRKDQNSHSTKTAFKAKVKQQMKPKREINMICCNNLQYIVQQ